MQDSAKQLNRVESMRKTFKSIIVATMAAGCMAFAGTANAGSTYGSFGYSSGHGGYGGGYSYGLGYSSGHYGYRGRRGHRGHGAGNALLGVGLGLLLFSAMSQPRRGYDRGGYDRGYDRGYRDYGRDYGREYGYERRPAEPYRYEPAPARSNVVNPLASAQDSSCLQTREYQMTVIIGGEEKDAYGTACLQPDGSWLQGPLTVVPEFN